jgi:histidinol-phosphate aminotransferase
VLANPNAPTGICEGLDFIAYILERNRDSVVIVDEAYIDFGGQSAIPLLEKYENLMIVHTFSKYRSLAGIRLSYVLGNEELIAHLNAVKDSFNSYPVNTVAQKLGTAALADKDYYLQTAKKIAQTRENFSRELARLGFNITDSKANFVFASHPAHRAADIFAGLKAENIFVRYFNTPRIDNHLRITIGTDAQMEKVAEALRKLV